MPDYEAPPGPPPPKVPEGWVARWNDQYKEWFYVNTFTKKSQWEKPTVPARPAEDDAPDGPPPSYTPSDRPAPSDVKRNPYDDEDDTRDVKAGTSRAAQEDEDARLARQLQDEEDARARSPAGSAASYPNTPLPPGSNPFPGELPPRDDTRGDKSRGLLGKLFGKKPSSQQQYPGASYAGGAYGQQQPPFGAPQGNYGGGPPPQGYGGYGPPPGGYYGGGPPPGGYYGGGGYAEPQGRPARSGGLGTAGGLALGAGAGLLGGMLISDVIEDHDQGMYQQGFDQGEMADGGGGGYGDGGDFGGGGF